MRNCILVSSALAAVAVSARAQGSAMPEMHRLPAPVAVSAKTLFLGVTGLRAIADGRLLVNDAAARRLVNVDTALRELSVISDTVSGSITPYGTALGGLFRYLADSSLLVETTTPVIYVIDPAGRIARSMAVPSPRDAPWLVQTAINSWPSTDAEGRLIYRGIIPRAAIVKPKVGEFIPYTDPDSEMILRADLASRKIETLAWYKRRKIGGWRTQTPEGLTGSYITGSPLGTTDTWTVLSDGTVAILRGTDYHLDLIGDDGKMTSTPRIPYSWERLSDSAKIAYADSVKKERDDRDKIRSTTAPGTFPGSGGAGGAARGPSPLPPLPDQYRDIKPEQLPDYRPAFEEGAMRPDARGNVWIRTLQPARDTSTAIYNVVRRDGKLLDRVEIPTSRRIVGFDKTNALYLQARDASGTWLERYRTEP